MSAFSQQQVEIAAMTAGDWDGVRAIYLEGIATGNATFEKSAPDWERWNAGHLQCCRLLAGAAGELQGWAALSPVSRRCVYGGVAEVSVYVAGRARGSSIALHQRAGFRVVGVRERLGSMDGRWRDVVLMERRSAVTGI